MTYYDQHLHTHHSYDSQADFTDYLDNSTGFVVTTEHFDVANPVTGQTDVPDYWAYSAEIEQLNIQYGNRILKGIEIINNVIASKHKIEHQFLSSSHKTKNPITKYAIGFFKLFRKAAA